MTDYNFSGRAFARIIEQLPAETPLYRTYEPPNQDESSDVWYHSQKEHLMGWFSHLAGAGAYNRKTRGRRAKQGYNSFQCAMGLIWLAEALGENPDVVVAAANESFEHSHTAAQCAAVRRHIPWDRIVELIVAQGLHNPASVKHTARTPRPRPRIWAQ